MSVKYTTIKVSKKLNISKAFVREICKALEQENYQFTKNQETRLFSENDIELMKIILKHNTEINNLSESIKFALSEQDELLKKWNEELDPLHIPANNVSIEFSGVHNPEEISINHSEVTISPQINLNNISLNESDIQIDHSEISKTLELLIDDLPNDFLEPTSSEQDENIEGISVVDEIVSAENTSTVLIKYEEDPSSQINEITTQPNQLMFEEFMTQITNLATQNEQILQQNQTLIQQNMEKDQKLEKILHSVEEKSEELQELAMVIEEKDEKLEQMFEEIQEREVGRDAQLMRMIREMQETKKMVAASKEKHWKHSIKSFFVKPKTVK